MQDYNTIIGAIQMRLNKCPTRSVMDRFRIGSSTLNLIMSRYKALELTIDELEAMSPKEVENLFYPQKNLQRKEVPLPDFQYYYDRIHAPNSRVNISFCWLDYKEKNPDGYEKSQFYEYYQRFVQENYGGTKISMAVNRKPGEKMYIDWVGDQPGLLTDVTTGEIMRVHIFATTLGVSSMIYAEAFPNEKLPCFIEGCVHAVSFYGAVAKHFVPDNLKTAVTKHTKDDLVLQSTFSDLEDFYDTIVLPLLYSICMAFISGKIDDIVGFLITIATLIIIIIIMILCFDESFQDDVEEAANHLGVNVAVLALILSLISLIK